MERSDLFELLGTVAQTPPRSLLEAHDLEAALIPHTDVPGIEDFVVALSFYEPTNAEQDGLLGYVLRPAAANRSTNSAGTMSASTSAPTLTPESGRARMDMNACAMLDAGTAEIVDALKRCLDAHGPITRQNLSSASKRVRPVGGDE
jgi:hypothetical protein